MTPKQLQSWRMKAGLSQPALAALLGVHPLTVSKWERAENGIPPYLKLALECLESADFHHDHDQAG